METAQKYLTAKYFDSSKMTDPSGFRELWNLADREVVWNIDFVRMVAKVPTEPVSTGPLFPWLSELVASRQASSQSTKE